MKNKYTIIFIPPDHSNTHQFQVSKQGRRVLGGGILLIGLLMIGLFAQNLYLSHYIKERQPTIDHIDQLKVTLDERDQEISHLNAVSNQINDDLKAIKHLEEELSTILNIQPASPPATLSRGMNPLVDLTSDLTIQALDHQAPVVAEHLDLLQSYYEAAVRQQEKLEHTPTFLPTEGRITSSFGYRRNPFGGRSTEFHNGIDIACNYGSPIVTTAAGVVTFAGWDPVFGHKIVIDHGDEIVTFYGHNSRLLVKKGDQVKKTDLIAYSGNSGRSTGSHLHYGTIVDGNNVDPLIFTSLTKEEIPDV